MLSAINYNLLCQFRKRPFAASKIVAKRKTLSRLNAVNVLRKMTRAKKESDNNNKHNKLFVFISALPFFSVLC